MEDLIERLTQQTSIIDAGCPYDEGTICSVMVEAAAELARLRTELANERAEVEKLRKDAERWNAARQLARYFPDPEGGDYVAFDRLPWPRTCHPTTPEYADAAIDAAITAAKESQDGN